MGQLPQRPERILTVCGGREFVDHRARQAGPREHGRQAAHSVRDRRRARESDDRINHIGAAAGGVLDPLEGYSATYAG